MGASKEEKDRRRIKVLERRARSIPVQAIADELGIDRSTVYRDIEKGLRETLKQTAQTVVALELLKLDRYEAGVDADASAGDPKAVGAAIKIMDHRAKLLGLYKVEPPSVNREAVTALKTLMAAVRAGVPDDPEVEALIEAQRQAEIEQEAAEAAEAAESSG